MNRLKTFLLLVLLSLPAFAQGVFVGPQTALKVVNGIIYPMANATITVCAANAGGIPCAPVTISIFKDIALTQPLSNPFQADAMGNYIFAVAPGTYTITVTGAGFTGYSYQVSASTGGGGTGTVTHTAGALTLGLPVVGNGGADIAVATKSGNTTNFVTTTGVLPSGHCAQWDGSGNLVDSGAVCGGGGGGSWATLTGGTNVSSAFVCGTGCSISASGAGTNVATSVPFSGVQTGTNGNALLVSGSLGASGTGTVTSNRAVGVNVQSGAGYTVVLGDGGKIVSLSNASAQTVLLPGTVPAAGWWVDLQNTGAAAWTVSPNGHTLDGAATSELLATTYGSRIYSDGTNYFSQRGVSSTAGVNSQTVNYSTSSSDNGKTIVMNGASLTLTLPNPPPSGTWNISVDNLNASGLVINRNGLLIDGAAANFTLGQNQGIYLATDGTNYFTQRGFYTNNAVSGVFATNFGVLANTKYVVDATITNGSNAITCGVTPCNFNASTDNGKICFGTNLPTTGYTAMLGSAVVLPQGTLTVTGANTATCSGGNATANGNRFIWGSDDTTALTNAWTAALAVCQTLQFPSGAMLIQSAIFGAGAGGPCTIAGGSRRNGLGLVGYEGVTVLIPTPNFNAATCTLGGSGNACIFGIADAVMLKDLIIDGQGNSNPGAGFSGKAIADLSGSNSISVHHIYCMGWGGGNTNPISTGYTMTSLTGSYDTIWSDGCGQTGVTVGGSGQTPVWYMDIADNGSANLVVTGKLSCYGCLFTDNGTNNNSCAVNIGTGGTLNSYGSIYGLGLTGTLCGVGVGYNAGSSGPGTFNSYGDTFSFLVSGAFQQIFIGANASAVAHIQDMKMVSSGASGTGVTVSNGGTLYDHGGNTYAGGTALVSVAAGGKVFGPGHQVAGSCTGTVTASQTLGLYNTGPNVTLTTCTSTTIGSGISMPASGNMTTLVVNASNAGVNASSGVVTVLKNGAGTTLTCTIGTTTACADTTHSVSYVAGDLISIQFTTQAADTLAGVKASVLY
jgi:hypothetical protein